MKAVVLPERELVPLRVRWRDDAAIVALWMLAVCVWLGAAVVAGLSLAG